MWKFGLSLLFALPNLVTLFTIAPVRAEDNPMNVGPVVQPGNADQRGTFRIVPGRGNKPIDDDKLYITHVRFESTLDIDKLRSRGIFLNSDHFIAENLTLFGANPLFADPVAANARKYVLNIFAYAKDAEPFDNTGIEWRAVTEGRYLRYARPFYLKQVDVEPGRMMDLFFRGLGLFNKAVPALRLQAGPTLEIAAKLPDIEPELKKVIDVFDVPGEKSAKAFELGTNVVLHTPTSKIFITMTPYDSLSQASNALSQRHRTELRNYLSNQVFPSTTSCFQIENVMALERGYPPTDTSFVLGSVGLARALAETAKNAPERKKIILDCLLERKYRDIYVGLDTNIGHNLSLTRQDVASADLNWEQDGEALAFGLANALTAGNEPRLREKSRAALDIYEFLNPGLVPPEKFPPGSDFARLDIIELRNLLRARGLTQFGCPSRVNANQLGDITIIALPAAPANGQKYRPGETIKLTLSSVIENNRVVISRITLREPAAADVTGKTCAGGKPFE